MGGDRGLSTALMVVAAVIMLVLSVVGAYAVGLVGAPKVVDVENRFGAVNSETTVVETDLIVNNPNPIGVQLGGTTVNYTVAMNDVSMASGERAGLSIAQGNTSLAFSTHMRNEQIPKWWVTHIRNEENTSLHIDARVHSSLLGRTFTVPQTRSVETDVIGQFNSTETRPVNASRPLVDDPVLYINRTGATWANVSDAETPIDMELVVYNPKSTPYTITEVGYNITMNDVPVGEGVSDRSYVIEGRSTETLRTQTIIRNDRLDDWWVTHLQNNQVTHLRIDFWARLELPTGTTIRIPLNELTYETEIETDIFGTKNESGSSSSGTPPDDGSGETSTTDSDGSVGSPTPTQTRTATPTQTLTPTETSDGIDL